MKKLIFVGPLLPPITGQSIAFGIVNENITHSLTINTAKFNNRVINTLYVIAKYLHILTFPKGSVIYFTCSRSNLGFVKDLFLLLIGRFRSMVIVNHVHGSDFSTFTGQKGFLGNIIRYFYKNINHTILLLEEMEEQLFQFPNSKFTIIPNCYSEDFERYEISEEIDICKAVDNEYVTIAYVSNIIFSKGILFLLDSVEFILEIGLPVRFKIAGDFVSDEFLSKEEIRAVFIERILNIRERYNDSIEYVGIVSGLGKYKLLAESSIFILPSFYKSEAFPISIIEAMRMGNAIITTNYRYLPCIINISNGRIIQPKNVSEIVSSISELILNRNMLIGIQKNNIEIAKRKYSQQIYIRDIESLLNTFLNLE